MVQTCSGPGIESTQSPLIFFVFCVNQAFVYKLVYKTLLLSCMKVLHWLVNWRKSEYFDFVRGWTVWYRLKQNYRQIFLTFSLQDMVAACLQVVHMRKMMKKLTRCMKQLIEEWMGKGKKEGKTLFSLWCFTFVVIVTFCLIIFAAFFLQFHMRHVMWLAHSQKRFSFNDSIQCCILLTQREEIQRNCWEISSRETKNPTAVLWFKGISVKTFFIIIY